MATRRIPARQKQELSADGTVTGGCAGMTDGGEGGGKETIVVGMGNSGEPQNVGGVWGESSKKTCDKAGSPIGRQARKTAPKQTIPSFLDTSSE